MRYQILQVRQRIDGLHGERAEWRVTGLLHRLDQRLDDLGFDMETSRAQLRAQLRERVAALSEQR